MLEQAKSDILILLDCCAAASSATDSGSGITEIIAACGFEAWAPGVGQHSFTRSLIEELRYLCGTHPFSTSLLHNKVLSRAKYWKPRYDPSARHREMRKTPVYIVISNEIRPRSIELEPRPPRLFTVTENTAPENTVIESTATENTVPEKTVIESTVPENTVTESIVTENTASENTDTKTNATSSDSVIFGSAFPSLSISPETSSNSGPVSGSSRTSVSEVWPDKDFECPKVLISVALEEEQLLSAPQWADWIRSVPGLVKYASVEGIYKSDSTLILISIPIAVWNLMKPNPAISFIGFLKSRDLLRLSPHIEAANPQVYGLKEQREDAALKSLTRRRTSQECADILEDEEARLFLQVYLDEIAAWMDLFESTKTVS